MLVMGFSIMAASAQSIKYDPTYSPNNYKHPNKAKAAREAKNNNVSNVGHIKSNTGTTGNYKQQNTKPDKKGEEEIVYSEKETQGNKNNALDNTGNYKTHR